MLLLLVPQLSMSKFLHPPSPSNSLASGVLEIAECMLTHLPRSFRAPHQITGWITVFLILLALPLHFLHRRLPASQPISLARRLNQALILIFALLELPWLPRPQLYLSLHYPPQDIPGAPSGSRRIPDGDYFLGHWSDGS